MILGGFSLLQSSASRSQFWLPELLKLIYTYICFGLLLVTRIYMYCCLAELQMKFIYTYICLRTLLVRAIYTYFTRTAPRTAQTFISRKNGSRAMILGRFSLLQSSASRSQFWLSELAFQKWSQQTPHFHSCSIFSHSAGYLLEGLHFLASYPVYVISRC